MHGRAVIPPFLSLDVTFGIALSPHAPFPSWLSGSILEIEFRRAVCNLIHGVGTSRKSDKSDLTVHQLT